MTYLPPPRVCRCACDCNAPLAPKQRMYASHACYLRHAATLPRPEQVHAGGRPRKDEHLPLIPPPPEKDTRDWGARKTAIRFGVRFDEPTQVGSQRKY